MPEYLAPGVYVEEVSFRSKSIEGVPTSTTGFAGVAHYGPVFYAGGPRNCEPRLITSFTEFERVYGGITPLTIGGGRTAYLGHAARAFFANGGVRLYVSRVFASVSDTDLGPASGPVAVNGQTATWRARWPGAAGNVLVEAEVVRSKNVAYQKPSGTTTITQAQRAKAGAVVEVFPAGTATFPGPSEAPQAANLAVVEVDDAGVQTFVGETGTTAVGSGDTIFLLEMRVKVTVNPERLDVYDELGTDPRQRRYVGKILQKDDPEDEDAVVWLEWPTPPLPTPPPPPDPFLAARLLVALRGASPLRLTGGNDGVMPGPDNLMGKEADPDDPLKKATGLEALGEIDDVAIVALPDGGTYDDLTLCEQAADRLIGHAEKLKYRIAVVDAPEGSSMTEVRNFRGKFDSTRAALYHPWIEILDPTQRASQGAPPDRLLLPPSGFVAGIYARSDVERGVHKAPANEVVRGLTRFEANINKPRQDVLNPEGINALRFFEGRGSRVWGARTMSSDPEWKYVNVRRLFIYIEHSIDLGTQWAVFEPNNSRLWANIRQTIEDFLLVLWRDGALLGDTPDDAFFVRCDRTTMTQNDLDNGRLIALIGVAPTKPAEFVIFRIGQYTAGAKI
jgi:uncharacterized protein